MHVSLVVIKWEMGTHLRYHTIKFVVFTLNHLNSTPLAPTPTPHRQST